MTLLFLLPGGLATHAQQRRVGACVELRADSSVIDSTTMNNLAARRTEQWHKQLHLKTNAVGWAMAVANVGVDVDIAPHLSLSLPLYYSAWNYFTSTVKFRTLALQPEVRYWLSPDNNGLFVGAHVGLASYNFAFGGDYRYQDHLRTTPAIGGGLGLGYRVPLGEDGRWQVELSVGGGVYALHYDEFLNTPNTKEGALVGSYTKCYWGIDRAEVSISYAFEWQRKGGIR